jgi:hypothetical protein
MVVTLDFHHYRQSLADIDYTGVLARTLKDRAAACRKCLEECSRVFVTAMLGPHHPEHGQLKWIRLPAESLADQVELRPAEAGGRVIKS